MLEDKLPPDNHFTGYLKSPYGYMKVGAKCFHNGHEVRDGRLAQCEDSHQVPIHWISKIRDGLQRNVSDTERLTWMIERQAYCSWSKDGDMCSIFRRSDDSDEPPSVPVQGYPLQSYSCGRIAIDSAMAHERRQAGDTGDPVDAPPREVTSFRDLPVGARFLWAPKAARHHFPGPYIKLDAVRCEPEEGGYGAYDLLSAGKLAAVILLPPKTTLEDRPDDDLATRAWKSEMRSFIQKRKENPEARRAMPFPTETDAKEG